MIPESIKEWSSRYGTQFYIGVCFLLVAALSFEAGILLRSVEQSEPLIIRTPGVVPEARPVEKASVPGETIRENPSTNGAVIVDSTRLDSCVFVGSKNSNKYHLPTTRCAKQIKTENLVCFASVDAALSKGYQPGCLE